jgi:hypothetical protein
VPNPQVTIRDFFVAVRGGAGAEGQEGAQAPLVTLAGVRWAAATLLSRAFSLELDPFDEEAEGLKAEATVEPEWSDAAVVEAWEAEEEAMAVQWADGEARALSALRRDIKVKEKDTGVASERERTAYAWLSPLARGSGWAGGRDHTPSRVPPAEGTTEVSSTYPRAGVQRCKSCES